MTGRRLPVWPLVGLAIYGAAVVLILVLPVSYGQIVTRLAEGIRGAGLRGFGVGWIEFFANVLMFVPLGFLLAMVFRRAWQGVALALVLSVLAETAQMVIPGRQPSLRDVLANLVGAGLGAAAALVWTAGRRGRRALVDPQTARDKDDPQR